jgi:hypothetical protein
MTDVIDRGIRGCKHLPMMPIPRFMSVLAALALAGGALVVASAPAQAKGEGIGSGKALVRLDVPTVTVTKIGKSTYRMVLPEGTTGQWMGERPNDRGKQVVRVGDLTAAKLSKRWTNFRYSDQPAYTTLIWNNDSPDREVAVGRLSRPRITDGGVRIDFTTPFTLPTQMDDVTINLARASHKPRGGVQTAVLVGSMAAWMNAASLTSVNVKLYNTSGGDCWGGSNGVNLNSNYRTVSVGSGSCAGTSYTNYVTSTPYGVAANFSSRPGMYSSATFSLLVNGFQANHAFTWS